MKIQQFYYGPKENGNLNYEETKAVSTLLPEDKIVELYTFGNQTNKSLEKVQLHQPVRGPPLITITFAGPIMAKGRGTTYNRTFLVSLMDITDALLKTLRPLSNVKPEKMEPLEIGDFTIINPQNSER